MEHYEIMISHNWRHLWDIEDLALAGGVHPQLVVYFMEYGLLEPVERIGFRNLFDDEAVARLKMIQRLRTEMGVNLAGIAIILDLTGKVRELQQEVEWLRLRNGI